MIGCQPVKMWWWPGSDVCAGAGRRGECAKDDMKLLGLQPEWAVEGLPTWGKRLTLWGVHKVCHAPRGSEKV